MRVHKVRAFSTLLFATALFGGSASAVLPDSGWYFNPDESGRGFNIEIQGDTLFMAGLVYDVNGNPIWVISGGPMSADAVYSVRRFRRQTDSLSAVPTVPTGCKCPALGAPPARPGALF